MQAATGCQVVAPRGRILTDLDEAPRQPLIGVRLVVRPQKRQDHRRCDAGRQRDRSGNPAPPAGVPDRRMHERRGRQAHRGEHEQVVRREPLRGKRQREPERCGHRRAIEEHPERQHGQRQKLEVHRLQVREPGQREGVEREQAPGEDAGRPVARPVRHHQVRRPAGQREPDEQQDVVDGGRGQAERVERHGHHALGEQVLREGQRVRLGVEDVGVEQMCRIARQLVDDPRHGPLVEQRVAVVVARQRGRRAGQRPGVRGRERGEQRERGKVPGAEPPARPLASGRRRWGDRHGRPASRCAGRQSGSRSLPGPIVRRTNAPDPSAGISARSQSSPS